MGTKGNAPGAESSGGGVLQSTRKETETGAPASGSSLPDSSSETINDFLSRFRPRGPWVLTAIHPDRKAIDTWTFDDADAATRWACEQNVERNVYFAVNPLLHAVSKKADREDVAAVEYLHVDIDPRAGEDLDEERERARALLLGDNRPEAVPPPTCVVFSGGGYQAFWKLTELIPIDGDLAKAEDAARYNQRLEVLLDADNTRDVCRIMRLPGTVNIPDARKRKKGRTETLATVVEFESDRVYPISEFEKAPTSNMPATTPTGPSEPTKLDSLDELDQYSVPDRVKVIIAQGHHPDETKERDNSRSAWLFDAVCNLIRREVPDGVVHGLITDSQYGISASVLDKGRNVQKYARQQIEKAKAVVSEGWPDGAHKDGKPFNTYMNRKATVLRLGVECSYDSFKRRPNIGGHALQQWTGGLTDNAISVLRDEIARQFGIDPKIGPLAEVVHQLCLEGSHDPVVEYLDTIRWDGEARLDRWVVDYLGAEDTELNRAFGRKLLIAAARRARKPGTKFDHIVVLEGAQGTGKSTALRVLAGDDFFSDKDLISLPDRDVIADIVGYWIHEIPELQGFRKVDTDRLKAFASRTEDHGRPAYGRISETYPRRCVFIGTTNNDTYLRDPTGNRRFWPVKTGYIDLDALVRDRDQLWAEAAAAEARGESLALPRELWAVAELAQTARMEQEPWVDVLADLEGHVYQPHGGAKLERVSTRLAFKHLDIPPERQTRQAADRLKQAMHALGWEGPVVIGGEDGRKAKGYKREPRGGGPPF